MRIEEEAANVTRCAVMREIRPCAGTHAGGTITVAPGHGIDRRSVREKLAALSGLPVPDVLLAAKGAWESVREYSDSVRPERFQDEGVFARYEAASARKDWVEADRLFLDALALDPPKYRRLLDAEGTMRAFSTRLCWIALGSGRMYRWIDPPELESCLGGTFESRIGSDGTRRGFKALSANPELQFGTRKIRMRVPVSDAIRRSTRCVQYTVMPRKIEEADERIVDPKSARYAVEAEVRVPDGTPIPPGADFTVMAGAEVGRGMAKALESRHRVIRLGG